MFISSDNPKRILNMNQMVKISVEQTENDHEVIAVFSDGHEVVIYTGTHDDCAEVVKKIAEGYRDQKGIVYI